MKAYYQDDFATIYHGNCVDVLAVLHANGTQVDHTITDPPYEEEAHTLQRRSQTAYDKLHQDVDIGFAPMNESLRAATSHFMSRLTRRWLLIFCQVEAAMLWRDAVEANAAWRYMRTQVWIKPDAQPQRSGDRPAMGYESIVTCHPQTRSRWNGGGKSGVYVCNRESNKIRPDHPTPKPLKLMQAMIADFSDIGETILDPFGGSGTTAVAAKILNRKCILIEQNEAYCELAAKRLQTTQPMMVAAQAITNGDYAIYEAIRAAAPTLDWVGHDRRAALARGATIAELGPDPAWADMLTPDPCAAKLIAVRVKLTSRDISRCKACKAPIWYRGIPAHPFDVVDGLGSEISHFSTCPEASKFRHKRHHQETEVEATTTTAAGKRRSSKRVA